MNLAFKRFFSWIIDMLIIGLILFIINPLFVVNKYEIEFNNLNEQYMMDKLNTGEYLNDFVNISQDIDKGNLGKNIITTILLVISFIIIPYLNKGQTLGQKILKIKIVKNDNKELQIEDLVGRSVIINGLGYMLFMLIILYLVNETTYFILISLLGFFQIIVVILNVFMVLYKKEHCGIADNFTKTRIEESK